MLLRRPGSFTDEPLISPSPLLMSPKHTYRCTIDWAVAHAQPIANRCTSRKCDELPTLRSIICASEQRRLYDERRGALVLRSIPKVLIRKERRLRAEKIKQKSRSYGGLSKGRLEAEGASLRDIRRYSNRGKLGESATFHRSRRLIFGRCWPTMSGLLTHRNNSIP